MQFFSEFKQLDSNEKDKDKYEITLDKEQESWKPFCAQIIYDSLSLLNMELNIQKYSS
jgi:hypothetical protein